MMKNSIKAIVALGLLAAGCDKYEAPPVLCNEGTYDISDTQTAGRNGCAEGTYTFTIAHTPQVDTVADPQATREQLPGTTVTITGGSPGVLLCDGPSDPANPCNSANGASQITTTVGTDGSVVYNGIVVIIDGVTEGAEFKGGGTLVTEVYGASSSCQVPLSYDLNCTKAQ